MKYEVRWIAYGQGIQSTQVEALNISAAEAQVGSMYANLKNFKIITTSPVFEKPSYNQPETQYSSSPTYSGGGSSGTDLSSAVGGFALFVGGIMVLFGLFSMPSGIIALIFGGLVGLLGMKIAFWLSDRGW